MSQLRLRNLLPFRGMPFVPALLVVLLPATLLAADPPSRLELGRRVQELESTWLATTDTEARARAVPAITNAIRRWFAADFVGVARELVIGEAILRQAGGATAIDRWAGALTVTPVDRILTPPTDPTQDFSPLIAFRVGAAFDDAPEPATGAVVEFIGFGKAPLQFPISPGEDAAREFSVSLPDSAPGDYEFTVRVIHNDVVLRSFRDRVSIVDRFEARVAEVRGALLRAPSTVDAARSPELSTANGLIGLLRATDYGLDVESPIRSHEQLARVERLAEHVVAGTRSPELSAPGDRWLRLSTGKTTTPCRVRVPTHPEGTKLPLVVGVHGMGGSENLFFEAHGLGLGPKLASERGWIFAAPGGLGTPGMGADIGTIITALESFLPVDRNQIYLIGRSLGAARIIAATSAEPTRYRAIAPLSGGGAIAGGIDLAGLPAFVAAGKEDFGLGMSMGLRSILEQANAAVTYKEYSPCEHMMLVPDSLPDVFRFFDGLVEKHVPVPASGKESETDEKKATADSDH